MSEDRLREVLDFLAGKGQMDVETLRKQLAELVSRAEGSLVNPERRGDELWSLCPYHDDRSVGSFSVNMEHGKYYCFVCGARGSIRSLLFHLGIPREEIKKFEAVLSPFVLKYLSDIDETDEDEPMMELPVGLLHHFDRHSKRMLYEKKHPKKLLEQLHVKYDRAFNRIVFPVWDLELRLVGVQSRAVFEDDWAPRWKWYRMEFFEHLSEQYHDVLELYDPPRKRVLYNEHIVLRSWAARGKASAAVLVEGPGHALRVMETGFPCMATFGASPSDIQLDRVRHAIRRAGNRPTLFLAYDADEAGMGASARIAHALHADADIRICELPPDLDPEDLTPSDLYARIVKSVPLSTMLIASSDSLRTAFQRKWIQFNSEANRGKRRPSRLKLQREAAQAKAQYVRQHFLFDPPQVETKRYYAQKRNEQQTGDGKK